MVVRIEQINKQYEQMRADEHLWIRVRQRYYRALAKLGGEKAIPIILKTTTIQDRKGPSAALWKEALWVELLTALRYRKGLKPELRAMLKVYLENKERYEQQETRVIEGLERDGFPPETTKRLQFSDPRRKAAEVALRKQLGKPARPTSLVDQSLAHALRADFEALMEW